MHYLERKISAAVIKRLPRYYRFLSELQIEGIDRISSKELSNRMHVTASQIRQDLNNFGGFGQQGYGYNVSVLLSEIGKILGLEQKHNIIVIGSGNLGRALAGYARFENRNLYIRALFDQNHALAGSSIRGLPVYAMEDENQNLGMLETKFYGKKGNQIELPNSKEDTSNAEK